MAEKVRVSSGVSHLDRLLGGLFVGDNAVWHDDSGNLASAFCLNFLFGKNRLTKIISMFK